MVSCSSGNCSDDANCTGMQKCCDVQGCGKICQEPSFASMSLYLGWGGGGEFAKIPKIHPNIPKINGSIVYCIPEIQRK